MAATHQRNSSRLRRSKGPVRIRLGISIPAILLFYTPVWAQIDSRTAEVQAARAQKALKLEPDAPSKAERTLLYIKDHKVLERITAGIAGFRLKLGGLATGSGFALGPEYLREDLATGRLLLRASAQGSFKDYQRYELEFRTPRTTPSRFFFDLYAVHRNYPSLNYYGPGPDSRKSSRSDFRREDTAFQGTFGAMPALHLRVGGSLEYRLVNVGPGTDDRFISTERVFSPAETVGIDRQANFLRQSAFVQYDYRDNPGGPRSGGNYFAQFSSYFDRTLDRHDFQRLDVEVQQYIPFFNKRRVLALRGESVLTFHRASQRVPFYLQPVLGGSEDLRGFRSHRFYDDNLLVVNAEYRWETFSGLDMALFVDAGKVFPRRAQWNFKDLEGSVGFGLRFNVRNDVFLRLDAGFSHEGFQVWIKFNNIFEGDPMETRGLPHFARQR